MYKGAVFTLLLSALLFGMSECANQASSPEVKELVEQFFPGTPMISQLSGGFSQASNYKITNGGSTYVLRLYQPGAPAQAKVDCEFYMMDQASKLKLSPHIHGIAANKRAILMDFIAEEKLSLEQIKQPAVLQRVGKALQRVHAIPRHSHPTASIGDKCEEIYQKLPISCHSSDAISLIRNGIARLDALGNFRANIHGDLNARNMFITEQKVLFIDWADTTWADPFYDVSCFAICFDLNTTEEHTLLHSYLDHEMTACEKERYNLTKQINLATTYLAVAQIASENQDTSQTGALPEQKHDWSYYIRLFSSEEELPPGFFHGCAMAALEMAKSLHTSSACNSES